MNEAVTLGTLLRHLLDLCDDAVGKAYATAGLDYRPRYTPVVRTLRADGPSSIRAIAVAAGITHSAVSQTVAQMVKQGLVTLSPGADGRERIVVMTPALVSMLPVVERHWTATEQAARSIDAELGLSLSDVLRAAIAALEKKSFDDRIASAVAHKRK